MLLVNGNNIIQTLAVILCVLFIIHIIGGYYIFHQRKSVHFHLQSMCIASMLLSSKLSNHDNKIEDSNASDDSSSSLHSNEHLMELLDLINNQFAIYMSQVKYLSDS